MGNIPHHIAAVMDGNGRWARQRHLPRVAGRHQGVESLRRCARICFVGDRSRMSYKVRETPSGLKLVSF